MPWRERHGTRLRCSGDKGCGQAPAEAHREDGTVDTTDGRGIAVRGLVLRQLAGVGGAAHPPHVIRTYQAGADDAAVTGFEARVAEAVVFVGPQPRTAGLLSELRGRPGRSVHGWLAWPREADAGCDTAASGLVTLVESRDRNAAARWSIGWLLVRPDVRRQGVGRALVATAVSHARAAGAGAVWTETSAAWPAAVFWQAVGFEQVRSGG
ncbi:MAG: GNAT family N-acetyltransferase [Planctomycetia bacterium]